MSSKGRFEKANSPAVRKALWKPLLCVGLVLLVFVIAAIVAMNHFFLYFNGILISRSSTEVDLRETDVTVEQYTSLSQALPDAHIIWNIPIGGQLYDCTSSRIVIDHLDPADLELFLFFDDLREVDAVSADCFDALQQLAEILPDCSIARAVHIGDYAASPAETILDLTGILPESSVLLEKLREFENLEQVILTDVTYNAGEQKALMEAYPQIQFQWKVSAAGKTWLSSDTKLSYTGESVDLDALIAAAPYFYNVQEIDLTGCGCSVDELLAVREAFGGAFVRSEITLFGKEFTTDLELLDLSGIAISDPSPIEQVLPLMPNLKKVDMCDCGISNEDMDALNKRHENVQFVWRVTFSVYSLRTDATYFCASDLPGNGYVAMKLTDAQLEPLKYCTELVALDLGHMYYTDLSFLENMPKLKYLILVEARFDDITPIGKLENLVFLELFVNNFTDLSPLLQCPNLQYLNIGFTRGFDPSVLMEMKQLKMLWYPGNNMSDEMIAQIQEALPNTICYMPHWDSDGSTGNGWRETDIYYEMRDFFKMHYMPGGTGTDNLK